MDSMDVYAFAICAVVREQVTLASRELPPLPDHEILSVTPVARHILIAFRQPGADPLRTFIWMVDGSSEGMDLGSIPLSGAEAIITENFREAMGIYGSHGWADYDWIEVSPLTFLHEQNRPNTAFPQQPSASDLSVHPRSSTSSPASTASSGKGHWIAYTDPNANLPPYTSGANTEEDDGKDKGNERARRNAWYAAVCMVVWDAVCHPEKNSTRLPEYEIQSVTPAADCVLIAFRQPGMDARRTFVWPMVLPSKRQSQNVWHAGSMITDHFLHDLTSDGYQGWSGHDWTEVDHLTFLCEKKRA